MPDNKILNQILVTEVLILSKQIERARTSNKNKPFFKTKTDIEAAISLIQDNGHEILSKLQ